MTKNNAAAQRERQAAKFMDLRGQKITLMVALVAFVGFLFLPYAGDIPGWQALVSPGDVQVGLMEKIPMVLSVVGLGILTTLTLITRRAVFGLVGWMMVTVAFFGSLWAFWFRGSTADAAQIGMWLLLLGNGLAFLAYCLVALRRSPEQEKAYAAARQEASQLDEVGQMQSEATIKEEENPLLIDDRRARAARRHRGEDEDATD